MQTATKVHCEESTSSSVPAPPLICAEGEIKTLFVLGGGVACVCIRKLQVRSPCDGFYNRWSERSGKSAPG